MSLATELKISLKILSLPPFGSAFCPRPRTWLQPPAQQFHSSTEVCSCLFRLRTRAEVDLELQRRRPSQITLQDQNAERSGSAPRRTEGGGFVRSRSRPKAVGGRFSGRRRPTRSHAWTSRDAGQALGVVDLGVGCGGAWAKNRCVAEVEVSIPGSSGFNFGRLKRTLQVQRPSKTWSFTF